MADTYLHGFSGSPLGGEITVQDGRDNSGSRMYGLFRFDLSSIAAGTTITSARLRLYQEENGTSGTLNVHVRRVTTSWDEATADWNNPWSTPGGDADAFVYASTTVTLGSFGWYEWDVTALVQEWIDGTYPNYGFYLDWDWVSNRVWCGFTSSESATTSQHPQLVITP